MKTKIVLFILLVLLVAVVLGLVNSIRQTMPKSPLASSSNGDRVSEDPSVISVGIGREGTAMGVKITPRVVMEDSRCPVDAVCIQAGTVRLSASVERSTGSENQVFKLNEPVIDGDESIELITVMPEAHAGREIKSSDYAFIFKVRKNSTTDEDSGK